MEQVLEKEKCTACSACINICPKGAIEFKDGYDGFKYPVIDQEKCIDCGLCKKTCPVINTEKKDSINKCYVGYNKDEKERFNASSGAIFSLVAKYILENKGVIVGAAFDKNNHLKHIAIEKYEDLESLKKSKYLQSDLGNIFKYIKEQIKNRIVLFVGTPCQAAGLKAFVKENNNLITIDLFCHGVPSPKLFEKYIKELEKENDDKVINYDFRDKETGWETYSNKVSLKSKEIITKNNENDYMKLFLSDVALREACYQCNFKLGNKYSDITLGDFWNVKKYYPEMDDTKGTSAIIINTEIGLNIFSSIKENINYKECKIEEIIEGNPSLVNSCKYNPKRNAFFEQLDSVDVRELSKKYGIKQTIINKMKNRLKSLLKNRS